MKYRARMKGSLDCFRYITENEGLHLYATEGKDFTDEEIVALMEKFPFLEVVPEFNVKHYHQVVTLHDCDPGGQKVLFIQDGVAQVVTRTKVAKPVPPYDEKNLQEDLDEAKFIPELHKLMTEPSVFEKEPQEDVNEESHILRLLKDALSNRLSTKKEQIHYIMQASRGHLNPNKVEKVLEKYVVKMEGEYFEIKQS